MKRTFESMHDFVKYIQNTPAGVEGDSINTGKYSEGWTGTRDMEHALELARMGWADRAKEIFELTELIREEIQSCVKTTFHMEYDVAGAYVDVGRFVTGEPECMQAFFLEDAPVENNCATLLVQVGAAGSISADAMMERGAAICAMIEAIEIAGTSTEIWVEMNSLPIRGGENLSYLIKVKGAGDHIDPTHIAFAVSHPSMFRRLGFAMREREDAATRRRFDVRKRGGYGVPGNLTRGKEIGATLEIPKIDYRQNSVDWIRNNLKAMGLLKPADSE